MSIVSFVKSNDRFKRWALWLLMPANDNRPRLWVRLFLNPFKHSRGKQSIIRSRTRLDVLPFNDFKLGVKSTIEDFATINNGVGPVLIGNNTMIGMGNVIIGPVTIGNNVMLAQHVVVSGLNHGYERIDQSPRSQKVQCRHISISDDVWIGANSVITAGVTIGKHVVVGAGSVVTKDVPEFSVVVGNPARVVKRYNFETMNWEKA